MSTIGQQLRELRGRTPHTVRSVASFLKYENHSRYAYYEGSRFKGPLPIDLARSLAELFYRSGKVQPHEVLALAGLSDDEAGTEEKRMLKARRPAQHATFISLKVRMPSDESLTEMFAGMLEATGHPELVDELSGRLAQLLPAALQVTPDLLPDQETDPESHETYRRLLRDATIQASWR